MPLASKSRPKEWQIKLIFKKSNADNGIISFSDTGCTVKNNDKNNKDGSI